MGPSVSGLYLLTVSISLSRKRYSMYAVPLRPAAPAPSDQRSTSHESVAIGQEVPVGQICCEKYMFMCSAYTRDVLNPRPSGVWSNVEKPMSHLPAE
jgi:hypothetical protein